MKTYEVHYEQTNERIIEVKAKNKEEAKLKADEILEKSSFGENVSKSQSGYFEHTFIDHSENCECKECQTCFHCGKELGVGNNDCGHCLNEDELIANYKKRNKVE